MRIPKGYCDIKPTNTPVFTLKTKEKEKKGKSIYKVSPL